MSNLQEGFKRINFFKGFFTQAEDWQQGQNYHIEKNKLHNRYLHTPGIVFGCLDDLNVVAKKNGTVISIEPGCAIDSEGRELYLSAQKQIKINPQSYRPPTTVYVIIKYSEEEDEYRPNSENPEYSGHAFVKEMPQIEISVKEPEDSQVVELARISLTGSATLVGNPKDPDSPKSNEIDRRYIKRAGVDIGPIKLTNLGQKMSPDKPTRVPGKTEVKIHIEEAKGDDRHRFYLVSAYPHDDATIHWRIESSLTRKTVSYQLILENLSENDVDVSYRVFRLY
jgi:hypothetical protein